MNCIPIGTKIGEGPSCWFKDADECCPFVEEGYSRRRITVVYKEYPRIPGEQKFESRCYCTGKKVGEIEGENVYEGLPQSEIEEIKKGYVKSPSVGEKIAEAVVTELMGGIKAFFKTPIYGIPLYIWIIIGFIALIFISKL
jgi:hypothetical protein